MPYENQMNPLTYFFSAGFIQFLVPVNAQDIYAE